jgi:hypothetical protein
MIYGAVGHRPRNALPGARSTRQPG